MTMRPSWPKRAATPRSTESRFRVDGAHPLRAPLAMFPIGRNRLAVPQRMESDRALIAERLADLDEMFDLAEPFTRIRDAIAEAQQAALG